MSTELFMLLFFLYVASVLVCMLYDINASFENPYKLIKFSFSEMFVLWIMFGSIMAPLAIAIGCGIGLYQLSRRIKIGVTQLLSRATPKTPTLDDAWNAIDELDSEDSLAAQIDALTPHNQRRLREPVLSPVRKDG